MDKILLLKLLGKKDSVDLSDQVYNLREITEELREIMWSAGVEYAYNKQFFVRAGYFNENEFKGNRKYFTAGAGFKLNVFQLDAGYVISTSQSNPLDQTLRFSLSFDIFGLQNLVK